ncbi:unnamed protein product, partial [Timema podura]|nr:unnamed protein product [Timema podura]
LLQPLSRLTYCAYLCHFTFLLLNTGLAKTTGYITVYTVVREYLGNMVLTLVTAAALSLTFEIPFLILDKNFLTRRTPAAASKPLTRDQARASVEAYISRDPEKNMLQDAEKHAESAATGSRVEELKSYTNQGFHH